MIEVYSWATPNGHKVHIMLEECGLPYRVHPVDIGAGDQFEPEFLAISPNNKIPAIVDPDGPDGTPISLFESGAILLYLAAQDRALLPADHARQVRGAAVADVPDGRRRPDARPGASLPHLRAREDRLRGRPLHQRSEAAVRRDEQAARPDQRYIAGPEYTIADIAIFPWLRSWKNQGIDWADYPHLKGWFDEIAARPAVQRGVEVLASARKPLVDEKRARDAVRRRAVQTALTTCGARRRGHRLRYHGIRCRQLRLRKAHAGLAGLAAAAAGGPAAARRDAGRVHAVGAARTGRGVQPVRRRLRLDQPRCAPRPAEPPVPRPGAAGRRLCKRCAGCCAARGCARWAPRRRASCARCRGSAWRPRCSSCCTERSSAPRARRTAGCAATAW